jgi:hypothetical protein
MKVIEQHIVNGQDYIISIDKKGRYFAHHLGDLIPSMIPGYPAGPERDAYPLNKMARYRNQYRYGLYTKGFKTIDDALKTIHAFKPPKYIKF